MADLKAIMARSYEAIERADWDALDTLFTGDCELVDPAVRASGLDEVKEVSRAYHRSFSELRFRVTHTVSSGDTVVLESTISGVHTGPLTTPQGEIPASGRRIELRTCEVARFR